MDSTVSVTILPDGRLDSKNAADYLGRKPKTLAQWRSNGNGPMFIKRGRVYYYKNDLDEWLNTDGKQSKSSR